MVVMHQLTFHFRAVCLISVCIGLWINVLAVAVVCDCPLTPAPKMYVVSHFCPGCL